MANIDEQAQIKLKRFFDTEDRIRKTNKTYFIVEYAIDGQSGNFRSNYNSTESFSKKEYGFLTINNREMRLYHYHGTSQEARLGCFDKDNFIRTGVYIILKDIVRQKGNIWALRKLTKEEVNVIETRNFLKISYIS